MKFFVLVIFKLNLESMCVCVCSFKKAGFEMFVHKVWSLNLRKYLFKRRGIKIDYHGDINGILENQILKLDFIDKYKIVLRIYNQEWCMLLLTTTPAQ